MPEETYHTDPETEEADVWSLVCSASSEDGDGWSRTTRRMEVAGGHVYQMQSEQINPDGSYSISQSSVFVPDVPKAYSIG
jgi:hypothetical protein